MCIVLATTAHPDYALIILDNRDEFILRPTSRPHWWSSTSPQTPNHENHHQQNGQPSLNQHCILSARDLHRAEQGTWLGITSSGNFAVLTNYREEDTHDTAHPVQGTRSRGGMVTAWLTAPQHETTRAFIHRLLDGEGVKGVGGFSLLVGKLRRKRSGSGDAQVNGKGSEQSEVTASSKKDKDEKQLEPMAIISNRCGTADDVPWVANQRGEVYGLSNAAYTDPVTWPKVERGKELLLHVVQDAAKQKWSEDELVEKLFGILDTDTLPQRKGQGFEEFLWHLRKSIFIPLIRVGVDDGDESGEKDSEDATTSANGNGNGNTTIPEVKAKLDSIRSLERPSRISTPTDPDHHSHNHNHNHNHTMTEQAPGGDIPGPYGTQRQTIILVDWNGHVTFRERALWEKDGTPIPRGEGDLKFEFGIEGWEGGDVSEGGEEEGLNGGVGVGGKVVEATV